MIPDIFKAPEFYDHFGVFIFAYLIWLGWFFLANGKKIKKWMYWSVLIIGILGLLVDFSIVSGILKTLRIVG